ncbi:MAG: Mu transposase C-terminal domain-containing protein [Hyphomonadaceae bacterium]|jgi:hypothetical protein|nr:Mu transposase C-terminal domain-containing protein [Hyphomonadaceae bacterium]
MTPDQEWWTPAELASACLPDLPSTRQGIDAVIAREGWRRQPDLARKRAGRGGGWEYHWTLLPSRARKALLVHAAEAAPKPKRGAKANVDRDALWARYDALPAKAKAKAAQRLAIIQMVEALVRGGATKVVAAYEVGRDHGVSPRSIFTWLGMVEGARIDDRMPLLAPRYDTAARAAAIVTAECSPEWWDALKADYLRLEQPSFTSCYRRSARLASRHGWAVLNERTARRRLDTEVSASTRTLARKGVAALKERLPSQTRDKTTLHAMEAVNADFHKWDVWVLWPGQDKPVRPQMVAWQDIYSGRVLAWRLALTPNKEDVALSFGEMVASFGIPDHVVFDNGREFANKFLTGQATHRHRFRALPTDIPGLLKQLGCEEHFATPYSGQSKPIERAFRDMCDAIARDPRFVGAWTGNRPDAKPENYQSVAVPFERFCAVIGEGIEEHNSRTGRRSEVASGRSFIEAFEASYATAPIRKATEAQRRLWLMGAEGIKADARTGLIRFQGNEYWAPWMADLAGKRVVVRFDPADLWAGVHLYGLNGAFLGHGPCKAKTGFFDLDGAKAQAKARAAFVRAEREALKAANRMKVTELSALLDAAAQDGGEARPAPQSKIVRPAFKLPRTATPEARPDPSLDQAQAALVADFARAREARAQSLGTSRPPRDSDLSRFAHALKIKQRLEAGQPVPRDQEHWLSTYQQQPEYRALARLHEDFGEAMFGQDGG